MSPIAEPVGIIAAAVLAGSLVAAAASDLSRYLIPNRFPVAIALAFAAQALMRPTPSVLGGLGVGFAILVTGAVLFARNILGGGDVKLLTAVSFWAGPSLLAPFLFITSLTGAVLGLVLLTPARQLFPAPPGGATASVGWDRLRQPIPFAVAIAAGGLFVAAAHVAPDLMR